MSQPPRRTNPYSRLGAQLQRLRRAAKETIDELSGAIEWPAAELKAIESGRRRPPEEVLMLIIMHFNLSDRQGISLWEMAGYTPPKSRPRSSRRTSTSGETELKPAIVVMPIDNRVVYTDMAHVMANDFGVILNFLQTTDPAQPPVAVARVGMSRQHAASLLSLLQATLAPQPPKLLPGGGSDTPASGSSQRS